MNLLLAISIVTVHPTVVVARPVIVARPVVTAPRTAPVVARPVPVAKPAPVVRPVQTRPVPMPVFYWWPIIQPQRQKCDQRTDKRCKEARHD